MVDPHKRQLPGPRGRLGVRVTDQQGTDQPRTLGGSDGIEILGVDFETPDGTRRVFRYAETFVVPAAAQSYRLVNLGSAPAVVVAVASRVPSRARRFTTTPSIPSSPSS